ncbi:MAG: potassium channel family protein [Patescibacteria group bacterium]
MNSFLITLQHFARGVWHAGKDPEFRTLFLLLIVLLVSGTLFYHSVENMRWIDALYFSVTTVTTVGYGDLAVQTDMEKIFTMLYIIFGIGIMFGFIEVIAEHAQRARGSSVNEILRRRNEE